MKNLLSVRRAYVVAACFSVPAMGSTTLLSTDFETDPALSNWSVSGAAGTPTSVWTTEQAASGTHSLKVQDGNWMSWYLPTDPFDYYGVSANIKSDGNTGFWGSTVQGHLTYPTTSGWMPTSYAFRAWQGVTSIQAVFGSSSPGATYVDDVVVSHLSRAEAKATLNGYYAAMPQYDFAATTRTHAQDQLPATIAKLKAGGAVNAVMLGDSIIGDTSNSFWEAQLDGQYPGKVNVTTSIRSSTGCWYYKDPAILQDYVLKYNPELVIIGGISHDTAGSPNDTADIASVIDQLRAYNPAVEILLLTETSSANNPLTNPSLLNPVDPNGTDWRGNLYRLAQQEHTGFMDMTESWANYIAASGQSYDSFLRDPIHDNARGETVIGHTLAEYFAPVPEPGMASVAGMMAVAAMGRRRRRRARMVGAA